MNSPVNYKIGLDIAEITSLVSVIKKEISNLGFRDLRIHTISQKLRRQLILCRASRFGES